MYADRVFYLLAVLSSPGWAPKLTFPALALPALQ